MPRVAEGPNVSPIYRSPVMTESVQPARRVACRSAGMSRFVILLILAVCGVGLLPLLLAIFWRLWDGYWAPRAEQAVAVAANALARGETPRNVTFDSTIDRSALSRSFASGWHVSGHDEIGLFLNGYEIRVRVPGDGQYNFDAFRSQGSWHLICCAHASEEEMRAGEAARQVTSHD